MRKGGRNRLAFKRISVCQETENRATAAALQSGWIRPFCSSGQLNCFVLGWCAALLAPSASASGVLNKRWAGPASSEEKPCIRLGSFFRMQRLFRFFILRLGKFAGIADHEILMSVAFLPTKSSAPAAFTVVAMSASTEVVGTLN